jgi:hypothetical protein
MSTEDSAEKIRRRMAELRRELECDVRQVKQGASVVTDWQFYVRRFPWAVAGAALVAGYLLVPKRKRVVKPDPEMIEELVRQKKIRVESVTPQVDKPGVMRPLLMMGLTYALRTGISYATQQMAAAAQNKAHAEKSPAEDHEPGPSPLHEPWQSVSNDG